MALDTVINFSAILQKTLFWFAILFSLIFMAAMALATWWLLQRVLKYNIKVIIFKKGQSGWQLSYDRGAVVKEKDKLGERKEKFVLLKSRAELPPFRSEDFYYSQGLFHISRTLILEYLGSKDYKPMGVQARSAAELTTRMDYSVWDWLVNELRNDANNWLKDEGFGAFLHKYGPYIAFASLFIFIFMAGLVIMNDVREMSGAFRGAAQVLADSVANRVPPAP